MTKSKMTGGANQWTNFVKEWSAKNKVTYSCAVSMPECKAEYYEKYPKKVKEPKVKKAPAKKATASKKKPPLIIEEDSEEEETYVLKPKAKTIVSKDFEVKPIAPEPKVEAPKKKKPALIIEEDKEEPKKKENILLKIEEKKEKKPRAQAKQKKVAEKKVAEKKVAEKKVAEKKEEPKGKFKTLKEFVDSLTKTELNYALRDAGFKKLSAKESIQKGRDLILEEFSEEYSDTDVDTVVEEFRNDYKNYKSNLYLTPLQKMIVKVTRHHEKVKNSIKGYEESLSKVNNSYDYQKLSEAIKSSKKYLSNGGYIANRVLKSYSEKEREEFYKKSPIEREAINQLFINQKRIEERAKTGSLKRYINIANFFVNKDGSKITEDQKDATEKRHEIRDLTKATKTVNLIALGKFNIGSRVRVNVKGVKNTGKRVEKYTSFYELINGTITGFNGRKAIVKLDRTYINRDTKAPSDVYEVTVDEDSSNIELLSDIEERKKYQAEFDALKKSAVKELPIAELKSALIKQAETGTPILIQPQAAHKPLVNPPPAVAKAAAEKEAEAVKLASQPSAAVGESLVDKFNRAKVGDEISIDQGHTKYTGVISRKGDKTFTLRVKGWTDSKGKTDYINYTVHKGSSTYKWDFAPTQSKGAGLDNACWTGYEAIGMKKGRKGKKVPNCVPKGGVALGLPSDVRMVGGIPPNVQGVIDAHQQQINAMIHHLNVNIVALNNLFLQEQANGLFGPEELGDVINANHMFQEFINNIDNLGFDEIVQQFNHVDNVIVGMANAFQNNIDEFNEGVLQGNDEAEYSDEGHTDTEGAGYLTGGVLSDAEFDRRNNILDELDERYSLLESEIENNASALNQFGARNNLDNELILLDNLINDVRADLEELDNAAFDEQVENIHNIADNADATVAGHAANWEQFIQEYGATDIEPESEAEGAGFPDRKAIKSDYAEMLKHLTSHIIDLKEPVDPRDYSQSIHLIKRLKKLKGGGPAASRIGRDIRRTLVDLVADPQDQFPELGPRPYNRHAAERYDERLRQRRQERRDQEEAAIYRERVRQEFANLAAQQAAERQAERPRRRDRRLPFQAFHRDRRRRVVPAELVEALDLPSADAVVVGRPAMATASVSPAPRGADETPLATARKIGGNFWDAIRKIGHTVGSKHPVAKYGFNPFDIGFDLGNKVIAPALMKVFPPRRKGGTLSDDEADAEVARIMANAKPAGIPVTKSPFRPIPFVPSTAAAAPSAIYDPYVTPINLPAGDEAIFANISSILGKRTEGHSTSASKKSKK